jgi:hypothetical protein
MFEKPLGVVLSMALAIPFAAAANPAASTGKLTAAEIVSKNVAARGGLQAWRAVQTMTWKGKLGVGVLVVPSLEKVGQLRQSGTPEAGRTYWMAFSNKGRLVKRGDRVNVVIGQFRAQGLVAD